MQGEFERKLLVLKSWQDPHERSRGMSEEVGRDPAAAGKADGHKRCLHSRLSKGSFPRPEKFIS